MYLNGRDKQRIAFVAAAAQSLSEAVEQDTKLPTSIKADMKRAKTWAWRSVYATLDLIDEKSKRQVVNIIKDLEIGIVSKRDAEEYRKEQEMFFRAGEHAFRLAEYAMQARCSTCDGGCRSECPLFEALQHFDVPPWDESRACPYAGAG